ncbi:MAG TPA: hypothetical protein PLJ00_02925 [Chitinophagales bacterium]|nr:hypothetical protein [Chitinophagales bacterium]HRG26819.1 hypothetical protein [Chitinophagales bacterium]HRG85589.1 hypothetical protein [Chitinophagales bacterium]
MTLGALSEKLRKRVTELRHDSRMQAKINAPLITIEIALGLTELAIDKNRPVSPDEEHWFHESWNIINQLERTEWDDIIDLYRSLAFKMGERNWFRN